MKTKVTLIIGSVALITLSFTFATVDLSTEAITTQTITSDASPIGGFAADEIVK